MRTVVALILLPPVYDDVDIIAYRSGRASLVTFPPPWRPTRTVVALGQNCQYNCSTMEASVRQVNEQHLQQLIDRIVEAVHPLRIIVFGSAARGEMGPDSDVDLLVVRPDGTHNIDAMRYIHRRLSGIPLAVDVLVTTPSTLERHRENIGLVYHTILREGREIHAV
jgi:predicted nucleotidyltransferase